ncbi:MAG: hypothetical protein MZV70_13705 [Desulfobacterales bacterium]|nr:hypothetical protein [Desulfobacterales bacterium]
MNRYLYRALRHEEVPCRVGKGRRRRTPSPPGRRRSGSAVSAHRRIVVSVALFYRSSKLFQLSESTFLDALERAGAGEPFVNLVDLLGASCCRRRERRGKHIGRAGSGPQGPQERTASLWRGLIRSLDRQFTASYAGPPDRTAPVSTGRCTVAGPTREKAIAAEKDGQWLAALELWTEVFHASAGDLRRRPNSTASGR